MVIYRFPPDSNEEESSKKASQQPGKMPDFIYVDDLQAQKESWESSAQQSPFAQQTTYPIFLRFLTFFVACLLTLWIGVLLALLLINTIVAIALLFKSPSTIETVARLWKSIGRFSAYALALFVATLNPAFGFGILALYALQSGENSEEMPFSKMFKNRF